MLEGDFNGGIFWDIENCRVPTGVSYEDIAGNIRKAVRQNYPSRGAITLFSAYADFSILPRKLRESCQRTGVKLVDVPHGRKDAADKAILVDMLSFAMDNKAPSFIVLISGDVDFSYALHILGQRGYTIMLVRCGGGVSPALINAGHYVLDWPTVASGGSFVSPKPTVTDNLNLVGDANRPDIQNKVKMVVSEANVQPENPSSQVAVNDVYCNNSSSPASELYGTSQSPIEKTNSTTVAAHCFTPSISVPGRNITECVRPRRKRELEMRIKWLINDLGGSLPLRLLGSEYHKKFGEPLHPHAYGFVSVKHLVHKMAKKIILKGKGNERILYVRISPNIYEGKIAENKNKEIAHAKEVDINRFSNIGSCLTSCGAANRPDIRSEDEMAVSKENIQPENPSSQVIVNEVYSNDCSSSASELNEKSQSRLEKSSTSAGADYFTPSTSTRGRNITKRVRPRREKELNRRIKWLIESHGGSLPLMLLCSEYHKKFGEPLYPHDYGFKNVEKLADKMSGKFILKGRGKERRLYVRISSNVCEGSIPIAESKNKETAHAKEVEIGNLVGCLTSCGDANRSDIRSEVEMSVSEANVEPENPSSQVVVNEVYCNNSSNSAIKLYGTSHSSKENVSSSLVAANCFTQSMSQGMPSALNNGQQGEKNSSSSATELYGNSHTSIETTVSNMLEGAQCFVPSLSRGISTASKGGRAMENNVTECQRQRLKQLNFKIKWLIGFVGGCLPLRLLCSEYHRHFGEPLYPQDYGFLDVEKLANNMNDKFVLVGKGDKKELYIHPFPNRLEGSKPIVEKKNKGIDRCFKFDSIFNDSSVQVKNVDPQLHGQSMEAKSEEPKLGAEFNLENTKEPDIGEMLDDASIDTQLHGESMEAKIEEPMLGAELNKVNIKEPEIGEMLDDASIDPQLHGQLMEAKSEEPKLGAELNKAKIKEPEIGEIFDDASIDAPHLFGTPPKDTLESFNEEAKELITCYSAISVCNFDNAYQYRYKKAIDYRSLGVESLEQLVEKSKDVKLWRVGVENYIVSTFYDYAKILSLDTLL